MLEVLKTKSAYWVFGYIRSHGGPFDTQEEAEKYLKEVKKRWHTQKKY